MHIVDKGSESPYYNEEVSVNFWIKEKEERDVRKVCSALLVLLLVLSSVSVACATTIESFSSNVEERTKESHWQEKICRQQNDENTAK